MEERIELKWKCGHTATYTFGYSHTELKAKMHIMASTLDICDSCKCKRDIEREYHRIVIMLQPKSIVMTGSDKQITWARSIRTAKYEALALVLDCLKDAYTKRQDEWPAIARAIKPVINDVAVWREYSRAGDIIDNRNLNWIKAFEKSLAMAGLHLGGLTS